MIDGMIPELKARVEVFISNISARACGWKAAVTTIPTEGKGGYAS